MLCREAQQAGGHHAQARFLAMPGQEEVAAGLPREDGAGWVFDCHGRAEPELWGKAGLGPNFRGKKFGQGDVLDRVGGDVAFKDDGRRSIGRS